MPVASSVVSWIETPSIKSTKLAVPLFSAITGVVYGSHSQILALALTLSPFLKNNFEPYTVQNYFLKMVTKLKLMLKFVSGTHIQHL